MNLLDIFTEVVEWKTHNIVQAATKEGKVFYRFEGLSDEEDVYLEKFCVIRETPKGCWIEYGGGEKFILAGVGKRFAYPTIEEAKISFLKRTEYWIGHLQANLSRAHKRLDTAKWLQSTEVVEDD